MVNEIRLSNFFYPISRRGQVHLPIKTAFKVCSINFDIEAIPFDKNPAQVEKWTKFDCADLSPIPLSEEWLLKFGFKECLPRMDNYFYPKIFATKKFSISIYEDKFYLSDHFFNEERIIIKYVHMLQNLHFYLTNDELKIVP